MIFGNKPETLKTLIHQTIESKGWQDKLDETRIPQIWSNIVGENVSSVLKVIKVDKGILFVRTESSTWSVELKLRTEQVIEKINKELGNKLISEIKII